MFIDLINPIEKKPQRGDMSDHHYKAKSLRWSFN
jgi:hypothetical protein